MINQVSALHSDVWGVILSCCKAKELSSQSLVCKLFYEIIGGEGFRKVWQRETRDHYPNQVHFDYMTKENDWRLVFLRFATFEVNLTRVKREPCIANQLLWAKSFIDGRIHYMLDSPYKRVRVSEEKEAFHLLKSFDSEVPKDNDSKLPKGPREEIYYYLGLCYEKAIGRCQKSSCKTTKIRLKHLLFH